MVEGCMGKIAILLERFEESYTFYSGNDLYDITITKKQSWNLLTK